MNFELSDEHLFIRDTLRKFMNRECPRERARQMEEEGVFPGDLFGRLAQMGFCALNVPEENGGAGQDALGAALALEECAVICPSLAGALAGAVFYGAQPLAALGSEDQRRRLLPQIAAGEALFTFALDNGAGEEEPVARAVVREGRLRLNGRKPLVPLAEHADYLLTWAQSGSGEEGVVVIVPRNAAGVRIEVRETLGFHGTGWGNVIFDEVELATEDLLGGAPVQGRGEEQRELLEAVDDLATAAIALGLTRGAYDYSAQYAGERVQFGQPIVDFEPIRHMLVDAAVAARAARWLLYHACWLADSGRPFAAEAAMARLQADAAARQAGLQSVHILGGYGYMVEYDAHRYLRDGLMVFSGHRPAELLKNALGAHLPQLAGTPSTPSEGG